MLGQANATAHADRKKVFQQVFSWGRWRSADERAFLNLTVVKKRPRAVATPSNIVSCAFAPPKTRVPDSYTLLCRPMSGLVMPATDRAGKSVAPEVASLWSDPIASQSAHRCRTITISFAVA